MPSPSHLHLANILIHIATGSLVILLGLRLLVSTKGDRAHRVRGRTALIIAGFSLATALLGAVIYRAKPDLLCVCLLMIYHIWAGLRALRLKNRGRGPFDGLPALMMVGIGGSLIWLFSLNISFQWEASRIYATAGGLITFGGYDLVRMCFPLPWRQFLNPAEHAFRMTCLVGAFISVACGTLFVTAYAALVPSGLFTGLACIMAARAARLASRNTLGVTPSAALKARLKTDKEL